MITAISFDVWNTLLRIDVVFKKLANAIAILKDMTPTEVEATIRRVYRKAKELRLYITDSYEVTAFPARSRALLANEIGIDVDELQSMIDMTFDNIDLNNILYEDVKQTLEFLNSINFKMGIIGNTVFWESIYTRELLERLGLNTYFKTQIYSDEIGIFKPDKRIFLEFCRRLNVKPFDVLHIGDNVVEDVGGAISSGMKAMLIDRLGIAKKQAIPVIGVFIAQNLLDVLEAIQILDKESM
jgi:putative hydrolase of the HAD superfamily